MQKLKINKWLKVCLLFSVATLPLFLSGCGGTSNLPTFIVSGNWNIYHTGEPTDLGPDVFVFTQSENDLSGTSPQGQSLVGNVYNVTINFTWTASNGFVYTYIGTINRDFMSGTWSNNNGKSGIWNAIEQSTVFPLNVTGNWDLFLTLGTGSEQGPFPATFAEAPTGGNGVTVTTPVVPYPIAGIVGIRIEAIIFSFTTTAGVQSVFDGTVSLQGTMSGTWITNTGLSGTWRAVLLP